MSAQTGTTSSARGLTLVGASAGSGKTHRITDEVGRAVDPAEPNSISPEQLTAVTYTRRAAGELGARIRKRLLDVGAYDRAHTLPLAYLGTVHSVCLRFVQELALDAGLSPKVDVLSGDDARWLREALEWGLPSSLRERIDILSRRLQLRLNPITRQFDWLTPVQDIMTLARTNRIAPDRLHAMGQRSMAGMLALLPIAVPDGVRLDQSIFAAIEDAAARLASIEDGKQNTKLARAIVEEALAEAKRGPLPWPTWIKLAKLAPAKAVRPVVAELVALASSVESHPRLHDDLGEVTALIFEAARLGLEAYDGWKRHRRVVDYVDMIDRALSLLDEDAVADELQSRLRLLVVDELQDTSPIQLALFTRLHRIVGRSTWVGDRKQCIFEFAGADPGLMESVTTWVGREGGDVQRLAFNWRSRPELVDACSHLFAAAFASPPDVVVTAKRPSPPALSDLSPFGVWSLAVTNAAGESEALAEGVRQLLAAPGETPTVDRWNGEVRSLRAGDVAVLVATNAEASRLTIALGRRGIPATVARTELMSTPEGTLVRAALGVVLDRHDTVSVATLEAMLDFDGLGPDAWLDARLTASVSHERLVPTLEERLTRLRSDSETMAPSESLDRVLHAMDVVAICRRWPNPEQRVGNIDALRALTAKYEERCTHMHEAATLAGLVRFLDEASERRLVRDEERASDDQHVSAEGHGVTIATYHKAKGLEWPVVILGSLDRSTRRDAFEVSPETDREVFDPDEPLAGRWIRYWPWPFAGHTAPLGDRAEQSATGVAVTRREQRERTRLLYVGFTRARDHLILAARAGSNGAKAEWLNELRDAAGPLVTLPTAADGNGNAELVLRGPTGELRRERVRWRLLGLGSDPPVRLAEDVSRVWFATRNRDESLGGQLSYWISPSAASTDWPELATAEVQETERIGPRLPLGRSEDVEWNVVGDALHSFLAADTDVTTDDRRRLRASRILAASESSAILSVEALLAAGDRLREWIVRRWPNAIWHPEYPVSALVELPGGARRVRGTIDLLLETDEGLVVIDHKSFPGPSERWSEKARELAPQLQAYAQVLEMARAVVVGKWIHFSIGGGVVRVG